MPFFGLPIRNGLPIGLGSVAGFGVQQFDPSQLFAGGTVAGAWYDPSDLSTLFTTSAGTTPVAMPGGGAAVSVGRMLDKSGNGNHAIAFNNTTARPELRARVNLFVWSEQFDNSFWNNRGASVSADTAIAPNGTLTADKIIPVSNGSLNGVRPNPASIQPGQIVSWYAKAAEISVITGQSGAGDAFTFNLSTGTFTADARYAAASMTNVGNGWYRCTLTYGPSNSSDFYLGASSGAGGSNGFLLWGADLRPANIGANVPAYQRIADANTYDISGFPLYLFFDGIDDSMYTPANLNLSGTDKISVFAGVRKLSDADIASVTELSANASSNNGSFVLYTSVSSQPNYGFGLRSTVWGFGTASTYTAPITNVIAGLYDIAGANDSDEIKGQVNGQSVALSFSGSFGGTGNFGTYPLYIGSRNNNSLRFNGQVYGLLVVGSAVSAGNISATEQWVAGKTGLQL